MSSSTHTNIKFWHPEHLVTEEKNILVILLWANDPRDPQARNQITFQHLAAITKAEIVKENPYKHDIKILAEHFEGKALYLNGLIDDVSYHDHQYSRLCFGMRVESDEKKRTEYVMDNLKEKYVSITESEMNEAYKLGTFLETLRRGIILERQYLERLKDEFQAVPDIIKQEFGLQPLSEGFHN